MGISKLMTSLAVVSLIATPTLAHATPAVSKLSLADARVGADRAESSRLAGGSVILAVVAAAAVIAGIIILADDDDEPESP